MCQRRAPFFRRIRRFCVRGKPPTLATRFTETPVRPISGVVAAGWEGGWFWTPNPSSPPFGRIYAEIIMFEIYGRRLGRCNRICCRKQTPVKKIPRHAPVDLPFTVGTTPFSFFFSIRRDSNGNCPFVTKKNCLNKNAFIILIFESIRNSKILECF